MGIHAGVFPLVPDSKYLPRVKIAKGSGREMGYDVVSVAHNGKPTKALGEGWCTDAPQNARSAEAVPRRPLAQIGADADDVLIAQKRKRAAVRIPDGNHTSYARIGEERSKMRLDRTPHTQKPAMYVQARCVPARIGLDGKIKVVFPVNRTVRMRKKDPKTLSLTRNPKITAVFHACIRPAQAGLKHNR